MTSLLPDGGGGAVAGDAFGRLFLLSSPQSSPSSPSAAWTIASRFSPPSPLSRSNAVAAVAAAAATSAAGSAAAAATARADGSLACFQVSPKALSLVASTTLGGRGGAGTAAAAAAPPPSEALCSPAPDCFFACTSGGAVQRWETSAAPPTVLFRVEEEGKAAVECCSWSHAGARLAIGSSAREVRVYDTNSASSIFTAKPERTNGMGREPNTSSAVALSREAGDEHLVAAGSGKGAIRLYDIRSQRRPVTIAHLPEFFPKAVSLRVTTLSLFCSSSGGGNASNLVAGTAGGTLAMLELRKPSVITVRGRAGGSAGAIRSMNVLSSPAQCLAGTEDGYVLCYALPMGSRSKFKLQRKIYVRAPVTAVASLPFMPSNLSDVRPEDRQQDQVDEAGNVDDEIGSLSQSDISSERKSDGKHCISDRDATYRPKKRRIKGNIGRTT